jgi:hypothetical protein
MVQLLNRWQQRSQFKQADIVAWRISRVNGDPTKLIFSSDNQA